MVRLKEHKQQTEEKAIEDLPLPSRVYLPLSQHLGKICLPDVKVGDLVARGQRIASVVANVTSPVHASISGKVVAIQETPHPVLGRCKAIVIESDGEDKSRILSIRSQKEVEGLSYAEIRNIIAEYGIVGMGGAGFPTHVKLNPPKPVDTLIINGAECEPYLTADYRLMLEKAKEILLGVELAARCLGAKNVFLAVEDNKPKAIDIFRLANSSYAIKILKSAYPQGAEKQLIRNILGKEVPRGKLPFDIGVVVQNVSTCFAIYEAVYLNKPLYERVITVTGSSLANPKNLRVRLGTPFKELIAYCGPLKEGPAKIISGGPMMGIAQASDEVPVIKSTTGIVLLTAKEAKAQEEEFCIRCGACIRNCPAGLMPCIINLASEREIWSETKAYGALDCIECGICDYLCPAKRRLTQSIKRAKLEAVK
ncbi:MAG TPA: electron transport complex subunit RsxC [Candidatus Margulisiibacteriota bacterium]|nr:electron transport complex subunit RsxC [Candidatus Margulisiibacteriota bacterium]